MRRRPHETDADSDCEVRDMNMKELRCKKCNKLLAKHPEDKDVKGIEIKCSRCKETNTY